MPHEHDRHDHDAGGHHHGASPDAPIACDLTVFSAQDRRRYSTLTKKLGKAVVSRRELDNGYSLEVALGRISLGELGDWMSLESKCCRFLEIALEAEGASFWLRLSGRAGTKEFLRKEMGI